MHFSQKWLVSWMYLKFILSIFYAEIPLLLSKYCGCLARVWGLGGWRVCNFFFFCFLMVLWQGGVSAFFLFCALGCLFDWVPTLSDRMYDLVKYTGGIAVDILDIHDVPFFICWLNFYKLRKYFYILTSNCIIAFFYTGSHVVQNKVAVVFWNGAPAFKIPAPPTFASSAILPKVNIWVQISGHCFYIVEYPTASVFF